MFWLVFASIFLLVEGQHVPGCCPDTWVSYEGSCYLFSHHVAMDFYEAERFCQSHGGHLVNVGGRSEDLFIRDFLSREKDSGYWMGLTDSVVEGLFKWRDTGLEPTYTDWNTNEPNQQPGNNEDCVLFFQPFNYKWADGPCSAKISAVCEKEVPDDGPVVG